MAAELIECSPALELGRTADAKLLPGMRATEAGELRGVHTERGLSGRWELLSYRACRAA
jgi:hypothetical protein